MRQLLLCHLPHQQSNYMNIAYVPRLLQLSNHNFCDHFVCVLFPLIKIAMLLKPTGLILSNIRISVLLAEIYCA